MPFLSDRQRSYLKREHPEVYARFVRDEGRTGNELRAPAAVAANAKRGLALREQWPHRVGPVGRRRRQGLR